MILGYNTNGFAFHTLEQAIEIIAGLGYGAVAITLDHHALNPFSDSMPDELKLVKSLVESNQLACVVETGSRFLLDPMRKHWPTLLERQKSDRDRRVAFLKRAIDIAAELPPGIVSFWSGIRPAEQPPDDAFAVLVESCIELSDYAALNGVTLAFEPEPEMFIDTAAKWEHLAGAVRRANFKLTLDVGHLWCNEEPPQADIIRKYARPLANVHLDDMLRGVHDHLFFGDGEVDFPAVIGALDEIGYAGPACIELSRHSHQAVETARHAKLFFE